MSEREAAIAEQRIRDVMGRCVHFTGIGLNANVTCAAGVRYHDVKVDHEPIAYVQRGVTYQSRRSWPCSDMLNHGCATCEKRATPSREEALARIEKQDRGIAESLAGLQRVSDATKDVKGGAGVVECPKCGGNLRWTKARINGRIWGRCDTPNCLAWAM